MSRLFRNATRLASTKFKFHVSFSPDTIKLHPRHIGKELIFAIRRGNKIYQTNTAKKATEDWTSERIEFDCSLYRDKKGKYQEKHYLIQVLEYNNTKEILFESKFDISTMVSISETLEMLEIKSPKFIGAALNIEVYCRFLKQQDGPGSEASTILDNNSVLDGGNFSSEAQVKHQSREGGFGERTISMDMKSLSPPNVAISSLSSINHTSTKAANNGTGLSQDSGANRQRGSLSSMNSLRRGSMEGSIDFKGEQDLGGFDVETNEALMKENEEMKDKLLVLEQALLDMKGKLKLQENDKKQIVQEQKEAFVRLEDLFEKEKTEHIECKQTLENLSEKLKQKEMISLEKSREITEQKSEIINLTDEKGALTKKITILEEEFSNKTRDYDKLLHDNQTILGESEKAKQDIENTNAKLVKVSEEYRHCQESLDAVSNKLSDKEAEIKSLNHQLQEVRIKLGIMDAQTKENSEKNYEILEAQLLKQISELKNQMEAQKLHVNNLEKRNEGLNKKCTLLEEELSQKRNDYDELSKEKQFAPIQSESHITLESTHYETSTKEEELIREVEILKSDVKSRTEEVKKGLLDQKLLTESLEKMKEECQCERKKYMDMEKEHEVAVEKLTKEHLQRIDDLMNQLKNTEADKDLSMNIITTDLETKIKKLEDEHDKKVTCLTINWENSMKLLKSEKEMFEKEKSMEVSILVEEKKKLVEQITTLKNEICSQNEKNIVQDQNIKQQKVDFVQSMESFIKEKICDKSNYSELVAFFEEHHEEYKTDDVDTALMRNKRYKWNNYADLRGIENVNAFFEFFSEILEAFEMNCQLLRKEELLVVYHYFRSLKSTLELQKEDLTSTEENDSFPVDKILTDVDIHAVRRVLEQKKNKLTEALNILQNRLLVLNGNDLVEEKEESETISNDKLESNEEPLKKEVEILSQKLEDLTEEMETKKKIWAEVNDELCKENHNYIMELTTAKVTIAELRTKLDDHA